MSKINDCMIDIETLSTTPTAQILTIGAIKFHRRGKICMENCDKFYRRITVESDKYNFDINDDTVKWWDKQDESVRYEAIENPGGRMGIKEALEDFNKWYGKCRYIWGNGSVFDITIMENAFNQSGVKIPWKFWNIRDVRTVYDLGNIVKSNLPSVRRHHALDDCYVQIVGVQKVFNQLG